MEIIISAFFVCGFFYLSRAVKKTCRMYLQNDN